MKTGKRTFRQSKVGSKLPTLRSVFGACGLALAIIFTMAVFPAAADTPFKEQAWREWQQAEAVSPQKAWDTLMASAQGERSSRSTTSETEITPEIQELARGLRHDPKLIFDYVHNHIEYTPTFGSIKGATGTYWAGRGNDCDQASLFIALMRASGYTADYVMGNVAYDLNRLANWLGAESDPSVIVNVLANAGIPNETGIDGAIISRIWAEAVIDGKNYTFDPAMKEHRTIPGIGDLKTALGYDRTKLLADAQSGATATADYVQNINETNIRKDMTAYTAKLVSYLKSNYPAASLSDIIGGREIIPTEMTEYPTKLPYIITVVAQYQKISTIPAALRHTLRVRFMGIDRTFNSFEIADSRLTLSYIRKDETVVDVTPVLKLDGNIAASGTEGYWGGTFDMTLTVDHPYQAQSGAFADQEAIREISLSEASVAAIVHDFDVSSPALIAHRNKLMSAAMFGGAKEGSEALLGESLSLMGMTYIEEVRLFNRLLDQLGKTVTYNHHFIGIVGQSRKYYFDLPMKSVTTRSVASADFRPPFRLIGLMGSAYEHGVLEQLQNTQALSTIKMLQLNNAGGGKTFSARQSNWAAVQPLLHDYTWEISEIATDLANLTYGPYIEYFLPEKGNIMLNEWSGAGYIDYYDNGDNIAMTMMITGKLHGGGNSKNCDNTTGENCVDAEKIKDEIEKGKAPPEKKAEQEVPKSEDPVEMAGGALNYRNTDLSFGFSEPLGLSFTRTYTSEDQYSLSPLGYGWSHNYEMGASVNSDGDTGLGARSAADAAAMLVYITAGLDLLKDKPTPAVWMTGVLATKWAMDQLTDNAVSVKWGGQLLKFIKLPDGAYNPPPGMSMRLTSDAAGLHLQDSSGQRIDFDPASLNATAWQDANGNRITLSYDTQGRLTKITDAFAKTLTLAYTGDRVTSLTDFAGRSVKYDYTNNNLTTYRDAENQPWSYAYDIANRMTKLFKPDPSDKPLVVNAYDSLGRVITQTDGLGNVTNLFFSGYRNTEQFPDGSEVTHFMDADSRCIARQEPEGKRLTFTYDGLGRLIASTDRAGNASTYAFHEPSGKIASLTDAEGGVTKNTYSLRTGSDMVYDLTRIDYADGTDEQFGYDAKGNLLTLKDEEGQIWQYAYDSHGRLTQTKNPAGGITEYVYNTDGTLASFSNSDTGKTLFDYDIYGRLTQTSYPDGSKTEAEYDLLGHLISFTDQKGVKTDFDYDANSNLVKTADSENRQMLYTYDLMNQQTSSTNRLGKTSKMTYNVMGQIASVTDPMNVSTQFGYDGMGRVNRTTVGGKTWKKEFDDEGMSISETTPLGHVTQTKSDKLGRPISLTDALNNVFLTKLDAMGRATNLSDALGRTRSMTYSKSGSLTGITMPVIGKTEYQYNALGLMTRLTDFNAQIWDFDYTPMGALRLQQDPSDRVRAYAYDTMGRMSQMTYADNSTLTLSYDAGGNIVRSLWSKGPDIQNTYNALGRLTATEGLTLAYDAEGNVTRTEDSGQAFTAGYDDTGRLRTLTYANSAMTVTYDYDASTGLLSRVSDNISGAWVEFLYDDDLQLITINRANGISTAYTVDAAGRLTGIRDGSLTKTISDIRYTLDAAGQITSLDMTAPLSPAQFTEGSQSLSFDAAGQVSSSGYAFDAHGRCTASSGHSYTWNGASQLTKADDATLTYNGLGDLRTRTQSGQTTHFYYNAA
ncbi:MAG: hypothetical protein BWK80_52275, partial [Desulfobacteraceae bacterium IS3]